MKWEKGRNSVPRYLLCPLLFQYFNCGPTFISKATGKYIPLATVYFVSHLPGTYPATMGDGEICQRLLVLFMDLKKVIQQ